MYIIKAHETKTVLMSHLQIYYEKLILKHAWLNLWDKHMTTGRINQVTKVRWATNMPNSCLLNVSLHDPAMGAGRHPI